MLAANLGEASLVRALLDHGADPRLTADDGWSAVQAAEMVGEDGIVRMLREAGG